MWKLVAAVVVFGLVACGCAGAAGAAWYVYTGQMPPVLAEDPAEVEVVEATPQEAPASVEFAKGRAAYDAGKYDEALAAFDEVVRARAGDPEALAWRGRTHARLNQIDRADADLSDAADGLPDDVETWRALAWVKAQKGDEEAAEKAWTHALGLAPEDAKLLFGRASSRFQLGARAGALADASRACELGLGEACTLRDRISRL